MDERQLEQAKQSMPTNLISSIEKEYGSFDYIKERPEDRGYYAITKDKEKFNSLEITKGSTGYTIYTEKDIDKDQTLSTFDKNIKKEMNPDLQKSIPSHELSR